MARVYAVASAKGGVGKTTVAANLGALLAGTGHRTAVLDVDLGMANLGQALGIDPGTGGATLHDVLAGEATVEEAIYEGPAGVDVLPGAAGLEAFRRADPDRLESVLEDLSEYEYVLLDVGAGLSHDTVRPLAAADEVVLVSTVDEMSLAGAERTREVADRLGTEVAGTAFVRADRTDVPADVEGPVLTGIPEDQDAAAAFEAGVPSVVRSPSGATTDAYRRLADELGASLEAPDVVASEADARETTDADAGADEDDVGVATETEAGAEADDAAETESGAESVVADAEDAGGDEAGTEGTEARATGADAEDAETTDAEDTEDTEDTEDAEDAETTDADGVDVEDAEDDETTDADAATGTEAADEEAETRGDDDGTPDVPVAGDEDTDVGQTAAAEEEVADEPSEPEQETTDEAPQPGPGTDEAEEPAPETGVAGAGPADEPPTAGSDEAEPDASQDESEMSGPLVETSELDEIDFDAESAAHEAEDHAGATDEQTAVDDVEDAEGAGTELAGDEPTTGPGQDTTAHDAPDESETPTDAGDEQATEPTDATDDAGDESAADEPADAPGESETPTDAGEGGVTFDEAGDTRDDDEAEAEITVAPEEDAGNDAGDEETDAAEGEVADDEDDKKGLFSRLFG